ncbi:Transcriptional accessory protein [Globisporangium polare]
MTGAGDGAQATRLESLFLLVREGSSAQIRENAAEKLGEVAIQSPAYCHAIVQQVRLLVFDSEWDVRVAASKCLEVIARSLRSERMCLGQAFASVSFGGRDASCPALNFQTVDIAKVVAEGAPLLRSGGEEYQYETNLSPEQRQMQAIRQRRLLLQRISGSSDAIWTTREDSFAKQMLPKLNADHVKDIADDIEQAEKDVVTNEGHTEKSQKAVKRKRAGDLLNMPQSRQLQPKATATDTDICSGAAKKIKIEQQSDVVHPEAPSGDSQSNDDDSQLQITASLVADLFESVFDSKWEVRHGALLALRQIFLSSQLIQSLASAANNTSSSSATTEKWLEECLMRCICVLALDQFVDYSADGSVSPVREVCAQVFGVLLGNLKSNEQGLLVEYLEILRTLFTGVTWHACHGALLGLKYLVLAHKLHAPTLIPLFYTDVLDAFEKRQEEEEVMVLAAEMFEDFTLFLRQTPHFQLQKTAKLLWKALAEHATSGLVPACVIRALSAWYNHTPLRSMLDNDAELAKLTRSSLHHVVPLLHQPIRAVRLSAVVCAAAMFQDKDDKEGASLLTDSAFERYLLPHLLLQLLKEQDAKVRGKLLDAWKRAVQSCSGRSVLVVAISTELGGWIDLLWSTTGIKLLNVEYQPRSSVKSDSTGGNPTMSTSETEVSSASRVAFADAIGFLGAHVPLNTPASDEIVERLSGSLRSASGERQCGALLTISRWAYYEKNQLKEIGGAVPARLQTLQKTLGPPLESLAHHEWVFQLDEDSKVAATTFYSEQRGLLNRITVMETRIIEIFKANGVTMSYPTTTAEAVASAADVSHQIAENVASFPYNALAASPEAFELAHFKRQDLFLVDETLQQSFARFYHRVQGLGSCAYSNLLATPPKKSGFLVKALMDSIKQEENADFRRLTAQTMADFVVSQAQIQRKCVAKILSNLCSSAVALAFAQSDQDEETLSDSVPAHSATGRQSLPSEVLRKAKVRAEGAENALRTICDVAGGHLLTICPSLNDIVSKSWASSARQEDQIVQQCSHLVCVLVPSVHQEAFPQCLEWLRGLATLVTQPFQIDHTRATAARAIAAIYRHAKTHQESAMLLVYQHVFAAFTHGSSVSTEGPEALLGATLVLHHLVNALSVELTPYIPSLVHFSMKAMSSQNAEVRSLAARAFADLVPLVPLQMDLQETTSSGDRSAMSGALKDIVGQNQVSRTFLENLLEGKAVKHVDVGGVLAEGVKLRSYQQHGVDWLSFLVENNLHGVLADDMGLGKTLQTLMAIAVSLRRNGDSDGARGSLVCLIVCPPVVTHHWITEAHKCLPGVFTTVVDYSGSSADRKTVHRELLKPSMTGGPKLIVTTYAVLRSDIELLKTTEYAFVVLDEAHLIRNPTTSLFHAVQQLKASHRTALSGTPLQNNVGDLWSLFEFLMPGYLGAFASFRREYVLPISKSRERNATPKQKETAALAITKLHQRVLPFILRRTKSQVLTELPPKIISNVLTTMTAVQKKLYALALGGSDNVAAEQEGKPAMVNVLTNLHLLRKICVHPALVASERVSQQLSAKEKKTAADWRSSGKMAALHDLLVDSCSIGGGDEPGSATKGEGICLSVSSQHRCLIFGHLKETLDVIEQMFKQVLPSVTYRRLDGRTPPHKRVEIVQQFNDDPSIDVLLLTTSVGGLGLTLTGADTVIFMEHSWNPFVDLQAMDRAHRIGQRRIVRVFRLIAQESLEEHIMDLQAFKERVATTVVATNDAQTSMNANMTEVLSLLQSSSTSTSAVKSSQVTGGGKDSKAMAYLPAGAQELLGRLGELWDEDQYSSLSFPDLEA